MSIGRKMVGSKKLLRERYPLAYVLIGLIPYSKPNMLLAFKPGEFFRELEKVSRYKRSTLESAYYRAQQDQLIKLNKKIIRLTEQGRHKIAPFVAKKLRGKSYLLVIFDIPEDRTDTRRKFRQVLKEWQFIQVQKSVWLSDRDLGKEVAKIVKEMGLSQHVQIYESVRHFPKT